MKHRLKLLYNSMAVVLFVVIVFSFANWAFASDQTILINENTIGDLCSILPSLTNTAGNGNEIVISENIDPDAGGAVIFNCLTLSVQNRGNVPSLNWVGVDNGNFTNGSFISPLRVSFDSLGTYYYSGYAPFPDFQNITPRYTLNVINEILPPLPESNNGFGSFLGTTTPLSIIGDVAGGVQATTGAISPVYAFAGVPVAFSIGGALLWFIRRSTG